MEFVSGRPLKDCLAEVPDQSISELISQLANAARYLEGRGIVHRDIKPENIFVSDDFQKLVLLDLGVARTIASPNDDDASATDHGRKRRFIATAQYSSPEYLFRLDEPSPELWKALSIYQCGAVLHDLINKRALFEREVALENRWLVARAVLTQVPRFLDGLPSRLPAQKALALRSLSKDMNTRLAIVSWDDFAFVDSSDPLADLQDKLRRRSQAHGEVTELVAVARLQHDRGGCATEFLEEVREKLIPVCGPSLPMRLERSDGGLHHELQFTMAKNLSLSVVCDMAWRSGLADRTADVAIAAYLSRPGEPITTPAQKKTVCSIAIEGDNGPLAGHLAGVIAHCLSHAIDVIEAHSANGDGLVGYDLVRHSLGP
jgi:serine/threonine-protein kinase